jgi:hypothetical protein
MHATQPQPIQSSRHAGAALFSVRLNATHCSVRAFPVAMIHDLLGFEHEVEAGCDEATDPAFVADVIESRMIAPPRPRRRRERAVSSRAIFYAGDAR